MPSDRRAASPSSVLRKNSLGPRSKEVSWVLRELKRQRTAVADQRKADAEATIESRRERADMAKAMGVHPVVPGPFPGEREVRQFDERRLKRELGSLHGLLGTPTGGRGGRAASRKKNAKAFDVTFGDPMTWGYIGWADNVTVVTSPLVSSGTLTLLPTTPVGEHSVPFVNQVRFAAVATSPFGYMGEMAWLMLDTAHVFSFESNFPWIGSASACSLTGWFEPNAVFRLDAPAPVYIFPWWHAVPHARMDLFVGLRADVWLPGVQPQAPPSFTSTNSWNRPVVSLSGWTGAITESGSLNVGPSFLDIPPFVLINGSRVVITAQYSLGMRVSEGATGIIDALTPSVAGLNVSEIQVYLSY